MYVWVWMVCSTVVLAYILEFVYLHRQRRMVSSLPTFYPTFPFIGHLHKFLVSTHGLFKLLKYVTQRSEETGLPFSIWLGPNNLIFFTDPEDIKTITNVFLEKPHLYSFARPWLGNGLVVAPVDVWKRSIKKIGSTYTNSTVDGFQDIFNTQALELVKNMYKEVDGQPFDVRKKYLVFTTLEAICQTSLGTPQGASDRIVSAEYVECYHRNLELLILRATNPVMYPEFVYRFTPSYRDTIKCLSVIQSLTDRIIMKRKMDRAEKRKRESVEGTDMSGNNKSKFRPFIDIILDLAETDPSLTDEQVKSEVETIIFGGHDTVATTIMFALVLMGSYPEIQNKLYAEIKETWGDSERPLSKDDLSRMSYCEAIIQETLRLYPPGAVFARHANHDLPLKSYTVPKGSLCVLNAWGAGRSRRLWGEDAERFRPERWLESSPTHSAAFLAFSYGRRACIGKKYAMRILKTLLSACVRSYIITSNIENLELKLDVLINPIKGHLIQIQSRTKSTI